MPDHGFIADVMAGDNEEAKALLRRLGVSSGSTASGRTPTGSRPTTARVERRPA